jgi:DNA-binding MarR family transcriptional regulator
MTGKVISMVERRREPSSLVLLTRLAKQVYRESRDRDLDMQLRHLVALSFLRDHEACPQQELADAFCMDANNVVLLLNELEDAEFASRQRDPHDRRRHVVQLSPAGQAALDRAERALEAVEDDVLGALDPQERKVLWQLLAKALRGVEPADGPAPQPVGSAGAA